MDESTEEPKPFVMMWAEPYTMPKGRLERTGSPSPQIEH